MGTLVKIKLSKRRALNIVNDGKIWAFPPRWIIKIIGYIYKYMVRRLIFAFPFNCPIKLKFVYFWALKRAW